MLSLSFIKQHWKTLTSLILVLMLSLGSFYYGRQSVKPQTIVQVQEKIVEKEKIVTVEVENKKQNKDITTTITEKPDGSKTTTITEHEQTETDTHTKIANNKEKQIDKEVTKTPIASTEHKYRLGLFLETHPWEMFDKPEKPSWGISASTRIVSNIWADTTYNIKEKTATLGISVEF